MTSSDTGSREVAVAEFWRAEMRVSKRKTVVAVAMAAGAVAIAIGAGLAVGPSAGFDDAAAKSSDSATAGTLFLDRSELGAFASWTVGNLAPSDVVIPERTFIVKNTGSVAVTKLTVTLTAYGTAGAHSVPEDAEDLPGEDGAAFTPRQSELPKNLEAYIYYQNEAGGSWDETRHFLFGRDGAGGAGPAPASLAAAFAGSADFGTGSLVEHAGSNTFSTTFANNSKIKVTVGLRVPYGTGNEVQGDATTLELTISIEQ